MFLRLWLYKQIFSFFSSVKKNKLNEKKYGCHILFIYVFFILLKYIKVKKTSKLLFKFLQYFSCPGFYGNLDTTATCDWIPISFDWCAQSGCPRKTFMSKLCLFVTQNIYPIICMCTEAFSRFLDTAEGRNNSSGIWVNVLYRFLKIK